MPPAKAWHLLPHQSAEMDRLGGELAVPPIVAQLLLNRGIEEAEAARRFLSMPFTGLRDPSLLPGAAEAADRLYAAIRAGRSVCIYGDYDVDGLTGTAILWQAVHLLGGKADYYVPRRLGEGYGVNADALNGIAGAGASLVVTVDCGIGSVAEADECRRLGLELIVTDHHEFKDRLPAASALVHPRLGGRYPFGDLSGSGVAFKVAWALCQRASGSPKVTPELREFLLDSVALAALGMVADWVPLLDENRIIVRHGLARLQKTGSAGLRALLRAANLDPGAPVTTGDIAFALAPRLNAAGRLGCARLVVELLTTRDVKRADEIARFLDGQNVMRRKIERHILDEAKAQASEQGLDGAPALVLASRTWHSGVIGIVAGRLAELYGRPVLMIAEEGATCAQGSGRSVPGFPLHEALAACGEGLISHGGHAAAAGFRIAPERIADFRDRFCTYAREHFARAPAPPRRLVIDAEIPLSAVTPGLLEAIARLEPYGAGNARPCFLAGPLEVREAPRRVGGGERHLQFRVRQNQTTLRAVAFNHGDRADELTSAGGQCCLVFTPTFNHWQGWRTVQLEVADFQPGCRAQLV